MAGGGGNATTGEARGITTGVLLDLPEVMSGGRLIEMFGLSLLFGIVPVSRLTTGFADILTGGERDDRREDPEEAGRGFRLPLTSTASLPLMLALDSPFADST